MNYEFVILTSLVISVQNNNKNYLGSYLAGLIVLKNLIINWN